MANASDLSLRGAKRRGNLGKAVTLIAHAIVGERTAGPGDALTVRTRHRQNGKRFRFVIARSEATWQSRSTRLNRGKAPAKMQLPSRDCTPRALPRASRSGRHVGRWPPRNDKSENLAPLNLCHDHCRSAWRSLSAATDAIGSYVLIGSLCKL